jgi:hypothetical protein
MAENSLSKSGSKPLVIKVQLKTNKQPNKVNQRDRNDDMDGLLEDDFCLEESGDEEEFSSQNKKGNRKRGQTPNKESKGNTRKNKRSLSDVGRSDSFRDSGAFSGGFSGFGGKEESNFGDSNFGKRSGSSRGGSGNTKAVIKDEPDSDEEDQQYYSYSGNFWKGISEYIVPFVKADLDFCDIDKIPNLDQKLFQIPNLGTHYKEIWLQEDQQELQEMQQSMEYSSSSMQTRSTKGTGSMHRLNDDVASNMSDEMLSERKDGTSNKPVRCGDITSRILAALLEDQLVPAHLLTNSYSGGSFQSNTNRATGEGNMTISTPTGTTTQQHTMQEIDDRLKKEVLSLNLIDQNMMSKINLQKEDDEICSELKRVQSELLEKSQANKQRRAKYFPLVLAKMEEQEGEKKVREEMKRLEEQLTRNLKNMKKRKRTPSNLKL